MPQKDEIETILRESGAWIQGHFVLTSGKHSDQFFLMARAFEDPILGERLGKAVADLFRNDGIQTVVGPAIGGVILAYEVARSLGCRAVFTEKTESATMALKRGFRLAPGERVLVVEDAVSTGGSVQKVLDHLKEWNVHVVGVGAVSDRTGGNVDFGLPFRAVVTFTFEHHEPESCPHCQTGTPLIRPKELTQLG